MGLHNERTPRTTPAAPSDDYSRNITTEETIKALKTLSNETSPDEDTIPYNALKNLSGPLLERFNKIFNQCFRLGFSRKSSLTESKNL